MRRSRSSTCAHPLASFHRRRRRSNFLLPLLLSFLLLIDPVSLHATNRTSVFNAYQWGFYSDPDEVDKLLDWLDPRGFNELKLRKEIVMYRDRIATHMEARKTYVGPIGGVEADGVDEEEEAEKKRQEEIAAAAAESKIRELLGRGRASGRVFFGTLELHAP